MPNVQKLTPCCRAKAVANGTILHFLDEAVTRRPVETSYGTTCEIPFQSRLKEHRDRHHLVKEYVDGTFIGPTFSCIAGKVENRRL